MKMSTICTILKFYFSNQLSFDGRWKRLWVTPQTTNQHTHIINLHISLKPQIALNFSFSIRRDASNIHLENSQTDGTTAQFKDEWVSGWVQICWSVQTNECMWEFMYTVQFVRWERERERRAATAGSGRFWSSGCQNLRPQHVHQRWEPVPVGRTEGLLMCWCRTGTNHCHQTPERERQWEKYRTNVLLRFVMWYKQKKLSTT